MIRFSYFTGRDLTLKLQNCNIVFSQVLTLRWDSFTSAHSHSLNKCFNEVIAGKTSFVKNYTTDLIIASEKLDCSSHLGNESLNHLPYVHIYINICVCTFDSYMNHTQSSTKMQCQLKSFFEVVITECKLYPSMNDAFEPLYICKDILFPLQRIFQHSTKL